MILYHFTCIEHLPKIEASGFIKVVESNISMRRPHAGPDVVWLTSDPHRNADSHGLAGSKVDKTAVRITVDVPESEVRAWIPWSRQRYITKAWASALEAGKRPDQWFVVERPVTRDEWKAVDVVREETSGDRPG
jgi:hypothetical protein